MKKFRYMFAVLAILLAGLLLTGCIDPDDDPDNKPVNLAGKVVILQAYGNSGSSGSPAGVSHSFVELYNTTNGALSLDGVGLYFADGTSEASAPNNATEDGAWKRISLEGKTIPAKGSLLILGAKHDNISGTRHIIADGFGDINDNNLALSNRAFKIALIKSADALTVQNPFTANSGKPVAGYIDMVGAANNYQGRDQIFGFETAPARCSASEAVRRMDLIDTDNNNEDFEAARYASGGMTNEEIDVRKPRNSSAGGWNPFAEPAEPPVIPDTVAGAKSTHATKLLILQAGASTDGAITRSFVELYNNTDDPINLSTFSLQYGTTGTNWTKINLTGSIPAKGSYLIRGPLGTVHADNRLFIDSADQTVDTFSLSNNGFKIALMENQSILTVVNPLVMTGGNAVGYVDMLGAYNSSASAVDAFEGALFNPISKQAAARRSSLVDSDNNNTDFTRIDYRTSGTTNDQLAQYRPRFSGDNAWDPFPEPQEPEWPTGTAKLMILQIGAGFDGNINRSFVELYNNTAEPIDLGTYSVQYASGYSTNANGDPLATATEDAPWKKIDLSGMLQPYTSYLIISDAQTPHADDCPYPALTFDDADGDILDSELFLNNRAVKVALINSQTLLDVPNPFTANGGNPITGYIDMIGAMNGTGNNQAVRGFEGATFNNMTKQVGLRRKALTDSNNNADDFERIVYLEHVTGGGTAAITAYLPAHELNRPKNSAHGAWNPITGEPILP
ncbi:MAG: hypothetical protein FWD22_03825 [Treponema sp.]|nr:hypothetical protein [Treponema sp.]